ncbi:MAG: hypothetical protein QOJ52_681, partial [Acidimicrobiaceae bacterium]|nr:hypothetical protein [Acidimicrobiaceae bacterium]
GGMIWEYWPDPRVWVPGANQNVTPGRFQLTALLSPAATMTEPAGALDGPVNSDASPHTDTGGDAGNDDATAAFTAVPVPLTVVGGAAAGLVVTVVLLVTGGFVVVVVAFAATVVLVVVVVAFTVVAAAAGLARTGPTASADAAVSAANASVQEWLQRRKADEGSMTTFVLYEPACRARPDRWVDTCAIGTPSDDMNPMACFSSLVTELSRFG